MRELRLPAAVERCDAEGVACVGLEIKNQNLPALVGLLILVSVGGGGAHRPPLGDGRGRGGQFREPRSRRRRLVGGVRDRRALAAHHDGGASSAGNGLLAAGTAARRFIRARLVGRGRCTGIAGRHCAATRVHRGRSCPLRERRRRLVSPRPLSPTPRAGPDGGTDNAVLPAHQTAVGRVLQHPPRVKRRRAEQRRREIVSRVLHDDTMLHLSPAVPARVHLHMQILHGRALGVRSITKKSQRVGGPLDHLQVPRPVGHCGGEEREHRREPDARWGVGGGSADARQSSGKRAGGSYGLGSTSGAADDAAALAFGSCRRHLIRMPTEEEPVLVTGRSHGDQLHARTIHVAGLQVFLERNEELWSR